MSETTETELTVKEENIDEFVNTELTVEAVSKYVTPKAVNFFVAGGILGSCTSYYSGLSIASSLYSYGLGAGIFGTALHTGSYIIKHYRKKDDYLNFAASGSVSGLLFVAPFSGIRKGLIAGLAGGAVGALYGIGSVMVYSAARKSWIKIRRTSMSNDVVNMPDQSINMMMPKLGAPPFDHNFGIRNPEASSDWRLRARSFFNKYNGRIKNDDNSTSTKGSSDDSLN